MLTSKHGAGVSAAAWQRGRNTRNLLDGRCKAGPRPVYPTRITKKPQNYSGRAIECNLSLLTRARAPPFGGARRDDCTKIAAMPKKLNHRSEEHTSELQTLMRNSYAVFC